VTNVAVLPCFPAHAGTKTKTRIVVVAVVRKVVLVIVVAAAQVVLVAETEAADQVETEVHVLAVHVLAALHVQGIRGESCHVITKTC
jgi:hypothetical protein